MKKILLADDEKEILALVSSTLQGDSRYVLLTAGDGDAALAAAKRDKPDIMFLDVSMPKKNGIEVLRLLKADPTTSKIKIVMLTGTTQKEARKSALDAGADDYITKPYSPRALLDKVDSLLTPRK